MAAFVLCLLFLYYVSRSIQQQQQQQQSSTTTTSQTIWVIHSVVFINHHKTNFKNKKRGQEPKILVHETEGGVAVLV